MPNNNLKIEGLDDGREVEIGIKKEASADMSGGLEELSRALEAHVRERKEEKALSEENKKDKKFKIIFIAAIAFLLVLAGVAWLGFFVFNKPAGFTGGKLKFSIETPESLVSGEKTAYVIKYANNESVPLRNATLSVRYPDGFEFKDAEPYVASAGRDSWDLGTIEAGQAGQVKIYGYVSGPLFEEKNISASLTYWPEGFNSEFQETASAKSKIVSSILDISVDFPEELIGGAEFEYTIKYKNLSKETDLENVKISAWHPADFVLISSDPEISDESIIGDRHNAVWEIGELDSNKEDEITVKGSFSEASSATKQMKVQIGLVGSRDDFYVQKEREFEIALLKGEVEAQLSINGKVDNSTVNFGDKLNYNMKYQNIGSSDLDDVELSVALNAIANDKDADLFDWASFIDENRGIVKDNVITWDLDKVDSSGKMEPGEEIDISFSISLKQAAQIESELRGDVRIENIASVRAGKVGDITSEVSSNSKKIIIGFNTDLGFSSAGRYFDDEHDPVGSGPVPPTVGEQTSYKIYWKVSSSMHDLKDVKVSSILPKNVIWVENVSFAGGSLLFDSQSREVSWTMERLASGDSAETVSFEVSVLPSFDQVGKIMVLLPVARIEAIDLVTGDKIEDSAPAITTNLDGDPLVSGKGVVVEGAE